MRYSEASAKIAAGPERVWEILVDGSGWSQWTQAWMRWKVKSPRARR